MGVLYCYFWVSFIVFIIVIAAFIAVYLCLVV